MSRISEKDFLRCGVPGPKRQPVLDAFGLRLTAPPSANACYRNPSPKEYARGVRGRIRTEAYTDWRDVAEGELCKQCAASVGSPVRITIRIGKCNQARDIDNFAKPTIDVLVRCGVIGNDNLKHVHSVLLTRAFGDVEAGKIAVLVEAQS